MNSSDLTVRGDHTFLFFGAPQPARSSIPAAQAVIQKCEKTAVNSPSLIGRAVSQINSEDVTIWTLFLLVVGVVAIFHPIIAAGIASTGLVLLAIYSTYRIIKSEEPAPSDDLSALTYVSNVLIEIAHAMETERNELQGAEVTNEKSIIKKDLIGRYSQKCSVEVFKGGDRLCLFNSNWYTRENIEQEIRAYCKSGEDRVKKLRELALILGTQSVANPFFNLGVGCKVTCGLGLQMSEDWARAFYPLWNNKDIITNAKVTLMENGLHIDELSFEIVIPQKAGTVNLTTGKQESGIEKLIGVKTVVRNVMFNVGDDGKIIVEKLDNYSVEHTVTKVEKATIEEKTMIAQFCLLAEISEDSISEALPQTSGFRRCFPDSGASQTPPSARADEDDAPIEILAPPPQVDDDRESSSDSQIPDDVSPIVGGQTPPQEVLLDPQASASMSDLSRASEYYRKWVGQLLKPKTNLLEKILGIDSGRLS